MAKPFLGIGTGFPLRLDPKRGVFLHAEYEESVRQSILIILGTAKGERVMRPDFGCGIHDLLFQNLSAGTMGRVQQVVREAWQAGRLDGIARITEERPLAIELERGVDRERLIAVKHALQQLLPLEQEVAFHLPSPLVPWLRAFLDDKRRAGLSDPEIRRRILEARMHGGDGRRTRVF